MKDWLPVLVAFLTLFGAGGGLYSWLTLKANKRNLLAQAQASEANTATILTKSAVELLAPLRVEASEARARASEARAEALEAREEVKELRKELQELTSIMRRWRAAVFAPGATLEKVRDMMARDEGDG